MDCSKALEYIHSLRKFKKKTDFSNIKKVLSKLDNPQNNLKFIHVAGTNGKGSVSTYLAEIFKTSGCKTGLFVSPFIIDFCERFQINGVYIDKNDLIKYVKIVKSVSFDLGIELSEFEFITVIAFLHFKTQNCDIVILETGIGGRLDATNVIVKPLCSVITKIDFDHSEILGDTLEKIAFEKCGIIKPNSKVVTTELQAESVKAVITKTCLDKNTKLYYNDVSKISEKSVSVYGNKFLYNDREIKTQLLGEHQFDNAMLSYKAAELLGVDTEVILEGLSKALLPARIEVLRNNPIVILDGSHNPAGVKALCETLNTLKIKDFYAVVAMMRDKDVEESLKIILPYTQKVFVTELPNNPRCISAKELKKISLKFCENTQIIDIEDISRLILLNKPLVVFGSLYFASDVRELLKTINRQ